MPKTAQVLYGKSSERWKTQRPGEVFAIDPIYFSQIEFCRRCVLLTSMLRLDLTRKELSYQVTEYVNHASDVLFSYSKHLSKGWMNQILPLCIAADFEPYCTCRADSWDEVREGCIGYRDCERVTFKGHTDSSLPEMQIDMTWLFDKEHQWPTEKLYQYLIQNILSADREVKPWL